MNGDIIKYKNKDNVKHDGKIINCTAKIIYNTKTASYSIQGVDEVGAKSYDYFPINEFEVIGNIYDNPDLLEKGAKDE